MRGFGGNALKHYNETSDKMNSTAQEKQVVSKKRVADHGEVLTRKREVNAMLDLVKQETERIDSRFLEPACGTGNFLTEILERKLRVVEARYGKSQLDYERYAILAVSSIYGIDIQDDNAQQCRHRLFGIFNLNYLRLFKNKTSDNCRESVRYILERNIIHGDALSLKTVGDNPKPIVFSEWSPVNGSMLKRRDFTFHGLLEHAAIKELPLFSDLGEDVFIPTAEKEYPLTHFLEVIDVEKR
jgi:SAM-dependent methyltransferase